MKALNQFAFRLARPVTFALAIVMSVIGIYFYLVLLWLIIQDPALVLPNRSLWTADLFQNALRLIGLPVNFFALYFMGISLVFILTFLTCGWLILLRRSQDWFGLYLALLLLSLMVGGRALGGTIPDASPWMATLEGYTGWLAVTGLILLFYYFPTGQVTPRWSRWFALSLGIFMLYNMVITYLKTEDNGIFSFVLIISCLGVGGYSQIYRYRHAQAAERQQVKWVVLALVTMAVVFIAVNLIQSFVGLGDPKKVGLTYAVIYSSITVTFVNLAFIGIPMAISFAVLRYRLWDVDVIIRRTLVYGVLTAALALVFFGGVTLLQGIFGGLTGTENSPVAIVLSTLAIAALFNPLRRRVQDFIDRRFYRKKYNAEKASARFAARAREETDIAQLSAELVAVVEETMQPENVLLWLKPLKRKQ